jgi:uncharacterized damage-inducible protein DinB
MLETSPLQIAIKQIEFARNYTLSLLADIDDADWFRQPPGCSTHVAWQVAHLAMAEYGLALFRQRGRHTDDGQLMSSKFRKQFSKGSTPDPDPANNPTPAEIRDVLDRVHQQALKELSQYKAEELDAPVDEPHAVFGTRLGALFFCSHHEMMHAGQIGLLRRLLGKTPIR